MKEDDIIDRNLEQLLVSIVKTWKVVKLEELHLVYGRRWIGAISYGD